MVNELLVKKMLRGNLPMGRTDPKKQKSADRLSPVRTLLLPPMGVGLERSALGARLFATSGERNAEQASRHQRVSRGFRNR